MKIERIQIETHLAYDRSADKIRRDQQGTEIADAVSLDEHAPGRRDRGNLDYTKEQEDDAPEGEDHDDISGDLPAAIVPSVKQPVPLPATASQTAPQGIVGEPKRSINVIV